MNWLYFFSAIIATFICLEPNENILLFDWIVVIYLILIQVSVPVSDSQDVSLASLKFCSSEETTNFSHDNVTSCQFKCSCDITHVCSEVVIFIATDKQWKLCEISALPWTKFNKMHERFLIIMEVFFQLNLKEKNIIGLNNFGHDFTCN